MARESHSFISRNTALLAVAFLGFAVLSDSIKKIPNTSTPYLHVQIHDPNFITGEAGVGGGTSEPISPVSTAILNNLPKITGPVLVAAGVNLK